MSSPWASSQARASCPTVQPFSVAISFTRSMSWRLRSKFSPLEAGRAASVVAFGEVVGSAEPTGEEPAAERAVGTKPMPSSRTVGRSASPGRPQGSPLGPGCSRGQPDRRTKTLRWTRGTPAPRPRRTAVHLARLRHFLPTGPLHAAASGPVGDPHVDLSRSPNSSGRAERAWSAVPPRSSTRSSTNPRSMLAPQPRPLPRVRHGRHQPRRVDGPHLRRTSKAGL